MRENPYCLAREVWGIGFLSADRLASSLGIGKDAEVRVAAGVRHALQDGGSQGHVFLPRPRPPADTVALLGIDATLVDHAIARAGWTG